MLVLTQDVNTTIHIKQIFVRIPGIVSGDFFIKKESSYARHRRLYKRYYE